MENKYTCAIKRVVVREAPKRGMSYCGTKLGVSFVHGSSVEQIGINKDGSKKFIYSVDNLGPRKVRNGKCVDTFLNSTKLWEDFAQYSGQKSAGVQAR